MLCLRSQLSYGFLAHLKPRIPKLLLPMAQTTRLTILCGPSDQLQVFSLLLMIVYSRFKGSRCPLTQANAENAGRKHLFLFPAWLSGLWELAREKDGALGNCKTKCQLSGYCRLYRLLGACISLTFKQSGRNPHSMFKF